MSTWEVEDGKVRRAKKRGAIVYFTEEALQSMKRGSVLHHQGNQELQMWFDSMTDTYHIKIRGDMQEIAEGAEYPRISFF
jgi:hypothetical protein